MSPATAQQTFDQTYISSNEIYRRLGISRVELYNARKKNIVPEPIKTHSGSGFLWLRDAMEPIIADWHNLKKRQPSEAVNG